jgi:Family of unknown function (DUF6151)
VTDLSFPLRCACGRLEGQVAATHRAGRAICYCHDCQAFARFLGAPETTLDALGGTDIIATAPRFVQFTTGTEQLQCMSLGPRGLLRWYAGCCRTPIGNTPRNPKLSYVGLVHNCLAGASAERDAAFGPARLAANPKSASGRVAATPLPMLLAALKILRNVGGSRLSGTYRQNPFFRAGTDELIVPPQVLTAAQRQALRGAN